MIDLFFVLPSGETHFLLMNIYPQKIDTPNNEIFGDCGSKIKSNKVVSNCVLTKQYIKRNKGNSTLYLKLLRAPRILRYLFNPLTHKKPIVK